MSDREWLNISATDYHELDAVSSGGLKMYEKVGPLEYYAAYVAKTKVPEETTAKRMGTAFHAAMEDPDRWKESYVVLGDYVEDEAIAEGVNEELDATGSTAARCKMGVKLNSRLVAHRKYREHFRSAAKAGNRQVMSQFEEAIINQQIDAVYDSAGCREYVGRKTTGNVELACVWQSPIGPKVKALVDLLVSDCIVDFKTTRAHNPYEFIREAEKHGYLYQAAHYLYVTGRTEFKFISVTSQELLTKGSPCEAMLWHVTPADLRQAHEKNMQTLEAIQLHIEATAFESEKDSQGIPVEWHNEGYGAPHSLPLSFRAFANMEEDF